MRPVRAGTAMTAPNPETEARALDAALTAVGRRGVRRLTVGSVCAQAGVSRATLYRYFTSKDELLEAVGRRAVNGVAAALEQAVAERPGFPGTALAENLIRAAHAACWYS